MLIKKLFKITDLIFDLHYGSIQSIIGFRFISTILLIMFLFSLVITFINNCMEYSEFQMPVDINTILEDALMGITAVFFVISISKIYSKFMLIKDKKSVF